MGYWQDAFGEYKPQSDPDAAVKFALEVILLDDRVSDLTLLLTDGHAVGALEGVPGWRIERRDSGPSGNLPYYADWPVNTMFHAHVDPNSFELGYPDVFLESGVFHDYVRKAISAYIAKNPSKMDVAQLVISCLT